MGNQCVLVVDDDPAIRLLCAIHLELVGLAVIEAKDGRDALARARSSLPDLVLTDVGMPRLDGFQLADALRRDARTRTIPLVFLSSETSAADRARAQILGAVAYLTKPFEPRALAALVADVVSRGRTSPVEALQWA